ncbi:MAG: DUF2189 domain-containing protein, partial [Hyphomicrobiaceae bacterium]
MTKINAGYHYNDVINAKRSPEHPAFSDRYDCNMPDNRFNLRKLTINDLIDVIGAGVRDFAAAPMYGMVFAGLFVLGGWLILALLFWFKLNYLAYPLAMGFALISPFAAVGFYAVSDLLERSQRLSWRNVSAAIRSAIQRDIRWMALVTGFALVIWLDIAAVLFFSLMGLSSFGPEFIDRLFTTPNGLVFLVLGNVAGAVIALFVFSISAISFPMLYDRDIDFATAMITSVRLVATNPVPLIAWCAMIGILTTLSIASAFVGLLIVMPVIGHTTWHLYRRA